MTQAPASPIDRAKFDIHPDVDPSFTTRVLTPRLRRLVETYVREGTVAAAARASGYTQPTVKRYIESDVGVRKAIGQIVDQAAILSGVTLERVLQEYARLAFADIADVIGVLRNSSDPDLAIEELANLPADTTAAISEVTITMSKGTETKPPEGQVRLKMYDKKSALQDLGRMLSLFNDKLTIEDKSGFGDRLVRAIEKIEGIKG